MSLDTHAVGGRPAPDLAPAKRAAAAACFDGQKVVLFGGESADFHNLDDTWVFDPSTGWLQVHTETKPPPRAHAGMAFDGTRAILFGGFGSGNEHDDTWAFDGTDWTKLEPKHKPSKRYAFGMSSYGKNNDIVLFGGRRQSGEPFGDTWVFFGEDWGKIESVPAPSRRSKVAMCPDNNGMQAVLFGGVKGLVHYTDTWFYSDTGWLTFAPPTHPGARGRTMMAAAPGGEAVYDQFMLFGGLKDGATFLGDTWSYVWDQQGGYWQKGATTGPPARCDASMALDVARNVVVLFGGFGQAGHLDDTWLYDGAWQQWTPPQR